MTLLAENPETVAWYCGFRSDAHHPVSQKFASPQQRETQEKIRRNLAGIVTMQRGDGAASPVDLLMKPAQPTSMREECAFNEDEYRACKRRALGTKGYMLDSSESPLRGSGVAARHTMNLKDEDPDFSVIWGHVVYGRVVDEGGGPGWLALDEGGFLPLKIDGHCILKEVQEVLPAATPSPRGGKLTPRPVPPVELERHPPPTPTPTPMSVWLQPPPPPRPSPGTSSSAKRAASPRVCGAPPQGMSADQTTIVTTETLVNIDVLATDSKIRAHGIPVSW